MRAAIALALAAAGIGVFGALFGVVLPILIALGVVLALAALLSRPLRESPGWWAFPGLRRLSPSALGFAGAILLYTVPVPLISYVVAHHGQTRTAGPMAQNRGPSPTAQQAPSHETLAPPLFPLPTVTPAASPSVAPSPTVAPVASHPPTPHPTAAPTPTPAPKNLCGAPPNPWNYNFCSGGSKINNPPAGFCAYFTCINQFFNLNGYVVECKDGVYSRSGRKPGECTSHTGYWRTLFM